MFDPGGKATITVTGEDGTAYEMDGYIASMNLTVDHGVACGAEVSFVGTGPPVIPDVVSIPGTFTPDVSIDTEEPAREWSGDALFITALVASLPIIYAGVKLGLWAIRGGF